MLVPWQLHHSVSSGLDPVSIARGRGPDPASVQPQPRFFPHHQQQPPKSPNFSYLILAVPGLQRFSCLACPIQAQAYPGSSPSTWLTGYHDDRRHSRQVAGSRLCDMLLLSGLVGLGTSPQTHRNLIVDCPVRRIRYHSIGRAPGLELGPPSISCTPGLEGQSPG